MLCEDWIFFSAIMIAWKQRRVAMNPASHISVKIKDKTESGDGPSSFFLNYVVAKKQRDKRLSKSKKAANEG